MAAEIPQREMVQDGEASGQEDFRLKAHLDALDNGTGFPWADIRFLGGNTGSLGMTAEASAERSTRPPHLRQPQYRRGRATDPSDSAQDTNDSLEPASEVLGRILKAPTADARAVAAKAAQDGRERRGEGHYAAAKERARLARLAKRLGTQASDIDGEVGA